LRNPIQFRILGVQFVFVGFEDNKKRKATLEIHFNLKISRLEGIYLQTLKVESIRLARLISIFKYNVLNVLMIALVCYVYMFV